MYIFFTKNPVNSCTKCQNYKIAEFINKSDTFKYFFKKNYFTNSLNFLPAENAGTFLAAIFKAAPV